MPAFYMALTKKKIVDVILNLTERFGRTDDSRKDETVIGQLVDQYRARAICDDYAIHKVIDRAWLSDLGVQTTHKVNFADDPTIDYSCGVVSKLFIPPVISLKNEGVDLGVYALMTPNGRSYYYKPMSSWADIPDGHVYSKMSFYDRINTALYINKDVQKVRPVLILESPEEGYIVSSTPVSSGSIVSGTVYKVKFGTIVYDGVAYAKDAEFTGTATTTFSGIGKVYLKSQLVAIAETSAYPLGLDMVRKMIIDICVTEFKIELNQVADTVNNSIDDLNQKV